MYTKFLSLCHSKETKPSNNKSSFSNPLEKHPLFPTPPKPNPLFTEIVDEGSSLNPLKF